MAAAPTRAVLADVAGVSAFFAVDLGVAPREAGWRALAELWTVPDALERRLGTTRRALARQAGLAAAAVEPRVAASLLYQGLAARLLSPALGCALWHGRVPDPAALRWRLVDAGPLPLRLAEDRMLPAAAADPPERLSGLLHRHVLDGVLAPLAESLRELVRIERRLLRGNAASALVGAAGLLARARPRHAAAAAAVTRALLAGPLAGTGELRAPGSAGLDRFVRRSCCLYYRLPGGATCGDCALRHTGPRRTPPDGPAPRA
ncbi:hypothetical protein DEF23_17095 [Marinitenerispora sediminis]|uniref:Ferric siderophore reductase C-terminal domain-containing protein n=1 Tax=Marinitenerispora sediminis TaxID=1931232 RepID=A0A368SXY7_9ACTN|nr:hypothetical protein DEF24_26330 [Marinitenerispora sediminis]RCV50294.1 hypothetical protein DEF28_18405 [Marinitenerispora sediminis]RCV53771.1 hypothetical protein DEF23_17095 [Marinitenerispora sediminis]